jgi:3D (Asp-Asp-Asp) domain-containing protein
MTDRFHRRVRLGSLIALLAGALCLGTDAALAQQDDNTFDLPPPANVEALRKLTLYSTFYYVFSATNLAQGGEKLLDKAGQDLAADIIKKQWCLAAVEGTVTVMFPTPSEKTFNFSGTGSRTQVDCAPMLPGLKPGPRAAAGKSRWMKLSDRVQYGLGDQNFRLVPFRSIAVDRGQSHFTASRKAVIYVPGLKGIKLKMRDGSERIHDGYLFAADTGGAIKDNHIDFFTGASQENPAPRLIRSTPSATFPAYIVTDEAIRDKLFKLHLVQ